MSSRNDSDGGSMTPSEPSDDDDRSEQDSDYETDEGEDERKNTLNIQWTGYGKRTPVILFRPDLMLVQKKGTLKTVGERYHLAYKFGNSECKIVRNVLNFHGFHEVHPNSSDFNFVWTGGHLKPFTLRSLTEFQKINHFPRSYELTRKDRLFKNIQRMQQIKGVKHFEIVPSSFILPSEYQDFCAAFLREKGTWIVKPVASSRGRGVFLCNHPDQVPLDENLIVCKYLNSPLLIDGFKFDVRLYVCVTSYDPLCIYLFEEGLTRFATVKYERGNRHIRNQCMHLTNYSVNKKSGDYVRNDDADVEDYGNKWSLGALLRYLKSQGKDITGLMMRIEDCVIKSILSVELPIATACKMFMPFRGNCFELYGFDILIDDNLKPWVLEVNLSPSLACDAPLDLKIKTNMLCDLFSLCGIVCHDPMMRTLQQSRRNQEVTAKIAARSKSARFRPNSASMDFRSPYLTRKQRPQSAGSANRTASRSSNSDKGSNNNMDKAGTMSGLTSEEIKILRRIKEEEKRANGWVRIFPTPDSWDLYSSFLQYSTTHNYMLHSRLYPERHKTGSGQIRTGGSTSLGARASSRNINDRTAFSHLSLATSKSDSEIAECYAEAILRTRQYERKLGTGRRRKPRNRRKKQQRKEVAKLVQGVAEEGEGEDEDQEEEEEDAAEEEAQNSPASPPAKTETKAVFESSSGVDNGPIVEVEKSDSAMEKKPVEKAVDPKEVIRESVNSVKEERKSLDKEESKVVVNRDQSVSEATSKTSEQLQKESVKVADKRDSSKPPPPPSIPPEPKYNVVDLLQKGHTLSKVQARSAFAMYLVRVQQRLISDQHPSSQEDIDALNEQMDLVLRFLKRAAVNLQQQFKVVVPSRKLPLNDRRRILAKQLGDFVHIYNKETEQLRMKQVSDQRIGKIAEVHPKLNTLCEVKFERFVNTASEGELEEVLTTYTKINKSASIFLGGGNGGAKAAPADSASKTSTLVKSSSNSGSETQLAKKKEAPLRETETGPKLTGWEDPPGKANVDTGESKLVSSQYHTPTQSSYANAVQIYTQKLSANRPKSASSQRSATSNVVSAPKNSRPMSAVYHNRPSSASPYTTTEPTVDSYNEQAIQEALQRLALRQQTRQYSVHNGTSVINLESTRPMTGAAPMRQPESQHSRPYTAGDGFVKVNSEKHKDTGKFVYVEEYLKSRPPSGVGSKRTKEVNVEDYVRNRPPSGQGPRVRPAQNNVHLQSANATFENFIDDDSPRNDLAQAYSKVTGVMPTNYNSASQSSKQFQILQQQKALKQQSKTMLEQSKAKHQAMVAQAYAMQKTLKQDLEPSTKKSLVAKSSDIDLAGYSRYGNNKMTTQQQRQIDIDIENAVQKYAPRPPTQPSGGRKTGSHRNQRHAVAEEMLNFNFSNSLNKPDKNTGLSRPPSGTSRAGSRLPLQAAITYLMTKTVDYLFL